MYPMTIIHMSPKRSRDKESKWHGSWMVEVSHKLLLLLLCLLLLLLCLLLL